MYNRDHRGVFYYASGGEWDTVPHCSGRSSAVLSNISTMISEFKKFNLEGRLVLYGYPNGGKDLFYHEDCLKDMKFAGAIESMERNTPVLDTDLEAKLQEEELEEAWYNWMEDEVLSRMDPTYADFRKALAHCQSNGTAEVIEESDGLNIIGLGAVAAAMMKGGVKND